MLNNNLPPGVTESMLPGNRPEDREWEDFHGEIDIKCFDLKLSVEDAKWVWIQGLRILRILRWLKNYA